MMWRRMDPGFVSRTHRKHFPC